jgi:hypothetical protein
MYMYLWCIPSFVYDTTCSSVLPVAAAHRRRESSSPGMPEEFHRKRYLLREYIFTPLAITSNCIDIDSICMQVFLWVWPQ